MPRPKKVRPVTPGQLVVLECLALLTDRLGEAPSPREIAADLEMTRENVMRMLAALEKRGYVVHPPIVVKGKPELTPAGLLALKKGKTN